MTGTTFVRNGGVEAEPPAPLPPTLRREPLEPPSPMRTPIALCLGLALLVPAAGLRADDPTPKSLLGAYEIVSGEVDGKEAPKAEIQGHRVRITPESIVATDKDGNELYVAKYNIETDSKPWKIAMTQTGSPKGEPGLKANGIIELSDDGTLKLAYAVEGGTPPESFDTEAGKKQNLFVLKRDEK